MPVREMIDCAFFLLALVNPISKVFVLTTLSRHMSEKEIARLAMRATVIAALILLSFTFLGDFVLRSYFHVEIYALKVTGGIVLFLVGLRALEKGVFFQSDDVEKDADLSVVPLASPLIAGPGTITAAISFPSRYGLPVTAVSITLALLINLGIMLFSRSIASALRRLNLMGALIRIAGLVVSTMGSQMVLYGIAEWHAALGGGALSR